jgi:hypothetical protein
MGCKDKEREHAQTLALSGLVPASAGPSPGAGGSMARSEGLAARRAARREGPPLGASPGDSCASCAARAGSAASSAASGSESALPGDGAGAAIACLHTPPSMPQTPGGKCIWQCPLRRVCCLQLLVHLPILSGVRCRELQEGCAGIHRAPRQSVQPPCGVSAQEI